jgi:hypothetical protein
MIALPKPSRSTERRQFEGARTPPPKEQRPIDESWQAPRFVYRLADRG